MQNDELQQSLLQLIEPFITSRGMDLVELQISGGRQRKVLRLFVDRPGGITIDDCARLSRSLADLLDTHDPIDCSYVLQVSSPGLTRPLRFEGDFVRAIGQKVRVIVDGGREYLGVVQGCANGKLAILQDDGPQELRLADVRKANLHLG